MGNNLTSQPVTFSGWLTTATPTGKDIVGIYNSSSEVTFCNPGVYSWTVPTGVSSISAVAVSGGNAGTSTLGGPGGTLVYQNNIPVTQGSTLYVIVGAGGSTAGSAGDDSAILIPNATPITSLTSYTTTGGSANYSYITTTLTNNVATTSTASFNNSANTFTAAAGSGSIGTIGSYVLAYASGTAPLTGNLISGTGIPAATYVTNVNGTNIFLSRAITVTIVSTANAYNSTVPSGTSTTVLSSPMAATVSIAAVGAGGNGGDGANGNQGGGGGGGGPSITVNNVPWVTGGFNLTCPAAGSVGTTYIKTSDLTNIVIVGSGTTGANGSMGSGGAGGTTASINTDYVTNNSIYVKVNSGGAGGTRPTAGRAGSGGGAGGINGNGGIGGGVYNTTAQGTNGAGSGGLSNQVATYDSGSGGGGTGLQDLISATMVNTTGYPGQYGGSGISGSGGYNSATANIRLDGGQGGPFGGGGGGAYYSGFGGAGGGGLIRFIWPGAVRSFPNELITVADDLKTYYYISCSNIPNIQERQLIILDQALGPSIPAFTPLYVHRLKNVVNNTSTTYTLVLSKIGSTTYASTTFQGEPTGNSAPNNTVLSNVTMWSSTLHSSSQGGYGNNTNFVLGLGSYGAFNGGGIPTAASGSGAGGYSGAGGQGGYAAPTGGGAGGGIAGTANTGGGGVNLYGQGSSGGLGAGGSGGYPSFGSKGALFGGGGGANGVGGNGGVRIIWGANTSFPSSATSVTSTIPQGPLVISSTITGSPAIPTGSDIIGNTNIAYGIATINSTPTGSGSAVFTASSISPTINTVTMDTTQQTLSKKTLPNADSLLNSKTSDDNLSTQDDVVNTIGWG